MLWNLTAIFLGIGTTAIILIVSAVCGAKKSRNANQVTEEKTNGK